MLLILIFNFFEIKSFEKKIEMKQMRVTTHHARKNFKQKMLQNLPKITLKMINTHFPVE